MKKADERGFREYSLSGNQYRLLIQVGTPLAIFALFNGLFTVSRWDRASSQDR